MLLRAACFAKDSPRCTTEKGWGSSVSHPMYVLWVRWGAERWVSFSVAQQKAHVPQFLGKWKMQWLLLPLSMDGVGTVQKMR